MLSRYGCTCSALAVETSHEGPDTTSPAIISFGLIQGLSFDEALVLIVGGFLGRIPPRFLYTCWLVGALTLAFQSWAKAPFSPIRSSVSFFVIIFPT